MARVGGSSGGQKIVGWRRTMRIVVVNDQMQRGCRYELVWPMGRSLDLGFRPHLRPKQMVMLGVFGGKYLTDCTGEFPVDWFERARCDYLRGLPSHRPAINA